MESKLRDAIAKGETILPQLWRLAGTLPIGIDEYKDAIESLLSLARTYLAVVEKGVLGFDEEAKKSDHYCPTCHAWYKKQMTSLLVEKEKEIARLSKEVNDLDHGLHKHQDPHWKMWERVLAEKRKEAMEFRDIACTQSKEIEDLESQLSKKTPTMEKLIEIIDSAIDKHFEKDMHTIPWVKFYGNPINFKQELADILIAKWGGKDD